MRKEHLCWYLSLCRCWRVFLSGSACWLPKLYTHAEMLLGRNKCWLSVEDQNSAYKVAQKRAKEAKCVGLTQVCYSVKGSKFVSHTIFRGPYTIHSEKPFLFLPNQSHTLQLISNIQKNWEEGLYTQKLRITINAFRSLKVPIRSQLVWGYDVNGNHVSPSDCKTCGFPLEVQRVASWRFIKS